MLAEYGLGTLSSAVFVRGLLNVKYNAEGTKTEARMEKLVMHVLVAGIGTVIIVRIADGLKS